MTEALRRLMPGAYFANLGGPRATQLAWVFVLYGLVATALLAISIPPFQNPDEPGHFMRAAQLADGELVGTRFPTVPPNAVATISAGGLSDPAIVQSFAAFSKLIFHPEARVLREMWAPEIHWSGGREMRGFPRQAINPPFFYAPSAAAVALGRAAGITVVRTLSLSRLLTGIAAVLFGAVAIACADGAAVWLFAVLTLPMSLSLMASCSQDALLLACSAVASALLMRALRTPHGANTWSIVAIAGALGLVAMARPPYVGLAILPLALSGLRLRVRVMATIAVCACTACWLVITAATVMTVSGRLIGADPIAQCELLLRRPWLALIVAYKTLAVEGYTYATTFVGVLGWLDTTLPPLYYKAAACMLGLAGIAALFASPGTTVGTGRRAIVAVGIALSALGVFAIQYVIWTPPGNPVVGGVQGRYFLPLALMAGALFPRMASTGWRRMGDALIPIVALFPVVTIATLMHAIMLRYYLG